MIGTYLSRPLDATQVMHPILKAVSAIRETWALPAVFELRKSTDDWADEETAAQSYNRKIKHGLDMDFEFLHRFKERFGIADTDDYWREIEGKKKFYPDKDAPSFKDVVCFLCQAEPSNIRLVVCGVTRHRCVLKGAVHASNLGFAEVIVVDELVRFPVLDLTARCAPLLAIASCCGCGCGAGPRRRGCR